jgi:hypothetical protein
VCLLACVVLYLIEQRLINHDVSVRTIALLRLGTCCVSCLRNATPNVYTRQSVYQTVCFTLPLRATKLCVRPSPFRTTCRQRWFLGGLRPPFALANVSAPTPPPATSRSQYHCPYSPLGPIAPFPQERCSQCNVERQRPRVL